VLGFGMSSDAYHITSLPENVTGAALEMKNALTDAGVTTSQIGYINTHSTSIPAGNQAEAHAVKSVFGPNVDRLNVLEGFASQR